MLGLLYEGRHLSLSDRRKITANVFLFNVYKRFFFNFLSGFLKRFLTFFYFWGNVFFSSMTPVDTSQPVLRWFHSSQSVCLSHIWLTELKPSHRLQRWADIQLPSRLQRPPRLSSGPTLLCLSLTPRTLPICWSNTPYSLTCKHNSRRACSYRCRHTRYNEFAL